MEFEYKGGNCVTISSKRGSIVIDGKLSSLGLKDIQPKEAVQIATQPEFAAGEGRVTIDMPGEYEVSNVSVLGIAAARHIDYDESKKATMYRLEFPDLSVAVLGHIAGSLDDNQLEALGMVDVLVIPVGGGGYTLDGAAAAKLVSKISPKVVIPTHYADANTKYEVPQDDLEVFAKELGATTEQMPKWKVKGSLPEALTLIELTRTA